MKYTKMQQIGLERIYRLFELAEKSNRSKRYICLAIEIGKKTRVRFPSELKTKYCKKCNSFLNRTNSEIQKKGTLAIVKCKECGFERKIKNL